MSITITMMSFFFRGGGRDSIVSTLEALRVISINFVLVISMIIDNHHDAFFFWWGEGGGGGGGR